MTMTKYRVANFNDHTPKTEQEKLRASLSALKGIDSVQLHPAKSEISLSFKNKGPEKSVLADAVTKAGFSLGTSA